MLITKNPRPGATMQIVKVQSGPVIKAYYVGIL